MRALTSEEVQNLLNGVDKYSELGKYMRLAIISGLRVSEILSIKWSDLMDIGKDGDSIPKNVLTIDRENLKGGKKKKIVEESAEGDAKEKKVTISSRRIKLSNSYKEYLIDYAKNNPIRGKYITVTDDTIRNNLATAMTKFNPSTYDDTVSSHSFRKFYAVKCYRLSGNDLTATQKMLSHKSVSSTGYYLSATISDIDGLTTKLHESLAKDEIE
jgi:integrase